ncbi:hypothetical protein DKX38_022605 [Salix brachista]|uniref:Uncharacterized protein n=1 Tax=Salix brachista TaxID=2182728 RepID=A0A5N5K1T4_9ROSI|nr:hypothetical protein DKX38_022605 [Salix brachista]
MAEKRFLAGLPSEFKTAKSQILSSPEIGSLQEVFSRILCIEGTLSIQQTNNVLVAKGRSIDTGRKLNIRGASKTLDSHINDSNNIVTTVMSRAIPRNSTRNYKIIIKQISLLMLSPLLAPLQGNPETFFNFQSHLAPSPVTIVDGSTLKVVGFGTIKPTSYITLSSVLARPPIVQIYNKYTASTPSLSPPPYDLDLRIGLCKGKCQCKSVYSIANFVLMITCLLPQVLLLPL